MFKFYPSFIRVVILFFSISQGLAGEHKITDSISNKKDSSSYSASHKPVSAPRHASITIAAFSSRNNKKQFTINPFISGDIGDYHFENRYNYEDVNSASVNFGKTLSKKIMGFDIMPMAGLVVGGFKGITSEIRVARSNEHWDFWDDNQYTLEYSTMRRSFYYNLSTGRYKVAGLVQLGVSTQFFKAFDQKSVFDKGLNAAFFYHNLSFYVFAFNYEVQKREYLFSLNYNLKLN